MHSSAVLFIVVFCVYIGLGLGIGLYFSRRASKGLKSFFIADKKLPWWAIAGAALGTYGGGSTFIGFIGKAWQIGISYIWTDVASGIGVLLMAIFLVPILARMSRVTMAEPLGERFNDSVREVTSFLGLIRMVGVTAITIVSIAAVIKSYMGVPFTTGALIAWAVLTTYVVIGGQYGIGYTDPIQGLLTTLTMIVAPIVLLANLGHGSLTAGWHVAVSAIPKSHLNGAAIPATTMIGWAVTVIFGNFLRPEMFRNIFAARSAREGVLAWVGVGSLLPILLIGNVLIGVIGAAFVPVSSGDATNIVAPTLFRTAVPLVVQIIYLGALLGTIVSVASSSLMGSASHYVADFHLKYISRNLSDRSIARLSRISVVVASLVALFWAVQWQSIINIFLFSHTMMVAGVLVPYLGMFFWPRITTSAALASAISGAVVALVWNFIVLPLNLFPGPFGVLAAVIPGLVVSIIVGVSLSYLTKPEYDKVLRFAETYKLNRLADKARAGLARQGIDAAAVSGD